MEIIGGADQHASLSSGRFRFMTLEAQQALQRSWIRIEPPSSEALL